MVRLLGNDNAADVNALALPMSMLGLDHMA
jgi:hypothetical protein